VGGQLGENTVMTRKMELSKGEDALRKIERDLLLEKIRALENQMKKTKSDLEKLKELKEKLKEKTKEAVESSADI
jgi:hypothetical protein